MKTRRTAALQSTGNGDADAYRESAEPPAAIPAANEASIRVPTINEFLWRQVAQDGTFSCRQMRVLVRRGLSQLIGRDDYRFFLPCPIIVLLEISDSRLLARPRVRHGPETVFPITDALLEARGNGSGTSAQVFRTFKSVPNP
jgi:hypothetical protein